MNFPLKVLKKPGISSLDKRNIRVHEKKAREHVGVHLQGGVRSGSSAINNRCNLHCSHCYILEPERDGAALSENYRAISPDSFNRETAGEIARDFRKAGTSLLTIPAMEPFLSDESRASVQRMIEEFAPSNCSRTGNKRRMALITNATLIHKLSDSQVSGLANGVEFLSVSLEGGESIHDKIRGEGNFRKALDGIKDLSERGYNPKKICLQTTIHPSLNPFLQARELLETANGIRTGRASFTAFISPQLTFSPKRDDIDYHEHVFREVLRACRDAEDKGLRERLITIYGTYESPAAVKALNRLIMDSEANLSDLEFNAFEDSYYLKLSEFNGLDVRLEVAPHPVEIPGYPRVASSRDKERLINITDQEPYSQGARMTSCFAYQTDEVPWAHWMPGLIKFLSTEMKRRGSELARELPFPKPGEDLYVDPEIPRAREEYFEETLVTGVKRQLRRTAELIELYKELED